MIDQILRRSLAALLLFVSCTVFAQETTSDAKPTPETTTTVIETDSRETQQRLRELMDRLPPDVGRVLKLDPTLWNNEAYIAHYPGLAAFLKTHPDVAHNPSFYLDFVRTKEVTPDSPSFRLWDRMMETISIFGAFGLAAFILITLLRTVIAQRRWSRLSKTQADVHNKLLDRFASNEELLNYIQTPAGRRFLESAPIPLDQPASRPVSAPIGRILWSVQAGLVTLAGGIGLQFVAMSVQKDAAEPIAALGTVGIAVGIGLVVSAAASFMLSRRLGLWHDTVSADTSASE